MSKVTTTARQPGKSVRQQKQDSSGLEGGVYAEASFLRELGVSPAALYEKLNHLEPNVSSALIRQTAADAAKVMDAMPAGRRHVLPGREIYYLDGNHLAGSEHRQKVELTDGPHRWRLRRITVQLNRPTANGDPEIHLLSDLPAPSVSAQRIVSAYRGRRTIEGVFQQLTDVLRCEVETLGYPKAALFAFATAVPAYNTYAVVKAALRCGYGESMIEEKLSDCHLMDHVARAHSGMEVAVDPVAWEPYQRLSARPLARVLVGWAKRVNLARYPKKKRGPKKPRPARESGDRNHHVATARLLAAQRE